MFQPFFLLILPSFLHPSLFSLLWVVSCFLVGLSEQETGQKRVPIPGGKKFGTSFIEGSCAIFFPKPSRLRAIHGVRFDFGSSSIEIYYDQLWIKKIFHFSLNGNFLFPPTFFFLCFRFFFFFFETKKRRCWSRYFASLWPLNASMMQ